VNVKVRKTSPGARLPKMEHEGDSGFDLYSTEDVLLKPMERRLVGTGIALSFGKGFEAQVRPKSGLAINHGITLLNTPGTIDSGYRGEVKVVVANLGEKEYRIEKGSKIAQLVFCRVEAPEIVEVAELENTARGSGGFGSTGLK